MPQSLQVPLFLAVRIPGCRQHDREHSNIVEPLPSSWSQDVKNSIAALAAVNKTLSQDVARASDGQGRWPPSAQDIS